MQSYDKKNEAIRQEFVRLPQSAPDRLSERLSLSWSNWGFGLESLADSAARFERHGITRIELHSNHCGGDLGYKPIEARAILSDHGIRVAGVCGMFGADNDLSSNRPAARQAAVDYLKREIDFATAGEAAYILVVPGTVGHPTPYDSTEFERSVETMRIVAPLFGQSGVHAPVEPIRSAELTFCHTVSDAIRYIDAVDHPGIAYCSPSEHCGPECGYSKRQYRYATRES